MPIQAVNESPILKKFLFRYFSNIKWDSDLMESKGILKQLQVKGVLILVFGIEIESVEVDRAREIMVNDAAIDNPITKLLYFHFGRAYIRQDLFNPSKNQCLARHRAWSSRFLHHEWDKNEEFGI